jgi:formate transporter
LYYCGEFAFIHWLIQHTRRIGHLFENRIKREKKVISKGSMMLDDIQSSESTGATTEPGQDVDADLEQQQLKQEPSLVLTSDPPTKKSGLPQQQQQQQQTSQGLSSSPTTTTPVVVVPAPSCSMTHQQPQPTPATKAPKDTLKAVYKVGIYKAGLPLNLLMVQSFMAGIYIAMAGHLFLAVGGGVLGAALFPTGLIAVVLTSAELFTGDALVFVASVLGGQVPFSKLLRNWTVSWIMNFAGCLFWASVLAYGSGAIDDVEGAAALAIKVALKKAHQPWGHILLKGIGANFLVCVGLWQGTSAEEVSGKILGLWFPIAAFVMIGFDHCIANQFFIPLGMMLGADISMSELVFGALLPASIGNVIGGGFLCGAVSWYVFDSMASSRQLFANMSHGWNKSHHRSSNGGFAGGFGTAASLPTTTTTTAVAHEAMSDKSH